MRFYWLLLIFSTCLTPAQSAQNCTACNERKCPPVIYPCPGGRAVDPCGCCEHCAKQRGQPCGGPDWELGYCNKGNLCAVVIGHGHVEIPRIGVCKPSHSRKDYYEDDDENCPEQHGCYRMLGHCECITKRTCILDSFQFSPNQCLDGFGGPEFDVFLDYNEKIEVPVTRPCTKSGCDIVDEACVCRSGGCDRNYQFSDHRECNNALIKQLCAKVTCPAPATLRCPKDSVATTPHTPPGECCPTIPSTCTCDFDTCNNACPRMKRKIMVWKSDGVPGRCCDRFLCLL